MVALAMAGSVALGARLGSYRVDSVIGGGGMSVVYRGAHVRLGTPAAIKILAPGPRGQEPGFADRFLRGVEELARLDHPNVIPIYDADVQDGVLYVAMRYVAGGDLKALLSRTGPVDPAAVGAILGPAATALDAAHARGLVHGGVKPSNVLLEWSPAGGVEHVYVTDFGMPAAADGRTVHGTAIDRYDYAAPEQLEGEAPTPRSDVYALGCVLYHCLTGRVPFGHGMPGAPPGPGGRGAIAPPSAARPGLTDAVDAAVLRALAADPSERFAGCGEVMAAFAAGVSRAVAEHGEAAASEPRAAAPEPRDTAPPPPAAAEPPASREPPARAREAPPPEPRRPSEPAARPRRRLPVSNRTAVALGLALVAAVIGFAVASQVGGDGEQRTTQAGADAATASGGALQDIVSRGLPDLACTVRAAPPGGQVVENATCRPKGGGEPARLTLARFSSTAALDGLFDRARALTADAVVRRPGDCGPDGPWGGQGRWAGGRMFCSGASDGTGGTNPSVSWTVARSRVLAQATGTTSADLGAWWVSHRDL
jgi:serine/threonine-protein kinase